jgi:hypothetical protein
MGPGSDGFTALQLRTDDLWAIQTHHHENNERLKRQVNQKLSGSQSAVVRPPALLPPWPSPDLDLLPLWPDQTDRLFFLNLIPRVRLTSRPEDEGSKDL